MEAKVKKSVDVDFMCVVKNPEVLFEEKLDWSKLKGNEDVVDALQQLYMNGCRVTIATSLDMDKVSDFLEKIGLIDFVVLQE